MPPVTKEAEKLAFRSCFKAIQKQKKYAHDKTSPTLCCLCLKMRPLNEFCDSHIIPNSIYKMCETPSTRNIHCNTKTQLSSDTMTLKNGFCITCEKRMGVADEALKADLYAPLHRAMKGLSVTRDEKQIISPLSRLGLVFIFARLLAVSELTGKDGEDCVLTWFELVRHALFEQDMSQVDGILNTVSKHTALFVSVPKKNDLPEQYRPQHGVFVGMAKPETVANCPGVFGTTIHCGYLHIHAFGFSNAPDFSNFIPDPENVLQLIPPIIGVDIITILAHSYLNKKEYSKRVLEALRSGSGKEWNNSPQHDAIAVCAKISESLQEVKIEDVQTEFPFVILYHFGPGNRFYHSHKTLSLKQGYMRCGGVRLTDRCHFFCVKPPAKYSPSKGKEHIGFGVLIYGDMALWLEIDRENGKFATLNRQKHLVEVRDSYRENLFSLLKGFQKGSLSHFMWCKFGSE